MNRNLLNDFKPVELNHSTKDIEWMTNKILKGIKEGKTIVVFATDKILTENNVIDVLCTKAKNIRMAVSQKQHDVLMKLKRKYWQENKESLTEYKTYRSLPNDLFKIYAFKYERKETPVE